MIVEDYTCTAVISKQVCSLCSNPVRVGLVIHCNMVDTSR